MEMLYLKHINEDGLVYLKIHPVFSSDDEFIFEGLEISTEKGMWEIDEYELSRKDLENLYEEGFTTIDKYEYDKMFAIGRVNLKRQISKVEVKN